MIKKNLLFIWCLFTFCFIGQAEGRTSDLYQYDELQRLENVVKLNSSGEKITEYHIEYNDTGTEISERHLVYAQGNVTRIYQIRRTYDALNRLTSIQEDVGSTEQKITSFHYNANGQIETIVKPNGTKLNHLYHDEGTLASFMADDGSIHYDYHYDEQFRLIKIEDNVNHITQTRLYNNFDELIEENLGSPFTTVQNHYDLAGSRTAFTLPDGSQIFYHYDGAYLASIERKGIRNYRHSYHYEKASGKWISSELPGELGVLSNTTTEDGKLLSIHSPWWSERVHDHGDDRITSLTIQDLKDSIDYAYTYGEDGQLIEETGHLPKKYQYDSLYNRLSEDHQPWQHNDLNQLVRTPQAEFSYDENGNLIAKQTQDDIFFFEYDALNRLVKVIKNDQAAVHYVYDAFNRQIQQKSYAKTGRKDWELQKTEFLLYDGHNEIGKIDEDGRIHELRILGLGKGAEVGAAIAIELENRVYAPIHDHQGSVRCLVDMETKAVAEFYRFTSFGLEEIYDSEGRLKEESPFGNPWRFSSKRHHPITGLVAYGKRHYDPSIGRWISPDPLFFFDTPNLYAFVKNDGVNHYDPYGLFSIKDTWNSTLDFFYWIKSCVDSIKNHVNTGLEGISDSNFFEKFGRLMYADISGGDLIYRLAFHTNESEVGAVGEKEISNKVRVVFINGILTTRDDMFINLNRFSETHGGAKIHYIFRASKGWADDILHCVKIKAGFHIGFRSQYTDLIVQKWRDLIAEMGGVNGGGTIIHYAHSLGGTETERARRQLTPEEQKMIRIITLGSATYIEKTEFQQVINYICKNDFTRMINLLSGYVLANENLDIQYRGSYTLFPPIEHLITQPNYTAILESCGREFLKEFGGG